MPSPSLIFHALGILAFAVAYAHGLSRQTAQGIVAVLLSWLAFILAQGAPR